MGFNYPKDFFILTYTLLITFLKYSTDSRDFCSFNKVPDGPKFTRFKQDFLMDLQTVFDNPVDVTEPICQDIGETKASMTILDTSGIEVFVTENNPQYANKIIKQLKYFKKSQGLPDSYDLYKVAYSSMSKHVTCNSDIK